MSRDLVTCHSPAPSAVILSHFERRSSMRINPVILSLALLPALLVQHVLSEEKRFAEATETNQQLMDL
jgi:hypothetical protein